MSVTNAALRKRVERLIAKWCPVLGLESWGLTVLFDEPTAMATCALPNGSKYEEAVLRFNLTRMKRELVPTFAAWEEIVVHELCHCLLAPHDSETRVSRVTRTILRARDLGR